MIKSSHSLQPITENADAALEKQGVNILIPLQEVGKGIKVACITDPFGNEIGLIENPHFK